MIRRLFACVLLVVLAAGCRDERKPREAPSAVEARLREELKAELRAELRAERGLRPDPPCTVTAAAPAAPGGSPGAPAPAAPAGLPAPEAVAGNDLPSAPAVAAATPYEPVATDRPAPVPAEPAAPLPPAPAPAPPDPVAPAPTAAVAAPPTPAAPDGPGATLDELPAGFEVLDFQLAQDVIDREPRGVAREFRVPIERLYAYTVLRNETGSVQPLRWRWLHKGRVRADIRLEAGQGARWRTWSKHRLNPQVDNRGPWTVELYGPGDIMVSSITFDVL